VEIKGKPKRNLFLPVQKKGRLLLLNREREPPAENQKGRKQSRLAPGGKRKMASTCSPGQHRKRAWRRRNRAITPAGASAPRAKEKAVQGKEKSISYVSNIRARGGEGKRSCDAHRLDQTDGKKTREKGKSGASSATC